MGTVVKKKPSERKCPHCKGNILIRNPTGTCDHLYYPENCKICFARAQQEQKAAREKYKQEKKAKGFGKMGFYVSTIMLLMLVVACQPRTTIQDVEVWCSQHCDQVLSPDGMNCTQVLQAVPGNVCQPQPANVTNATTTNVTISFG
jgi:hypothetical protein